MTEKDQQILDRFTVILPTLSEFEKEYLLGFGNGMFASAECQDTKQVALQTN